MTEEELKVIIDEIEDEGVLETQESNLVRSALEFDEITVDEIITPRVRIVAVENTASVEEVREKFLSEEYSRMPVYEKTLDNIIGTITEKDFFKAYEKNGTDCVLILADGTILKRSAWREPCVQFNVAMASNGTCAPVDDGM